MAALYKILKAAAHINHLRISRVSSTAKYFSCTPIKHLNVDTTLMDNEDKDVVAKADKVLDFVEGKDRQYYPSHIRVYTDATLQKETTEKRSGVGVFCKEVIGLQRSLRVNDRTDVDVGETLALWGAMKLISESEIPKGMNKFLILSDSQNAIRALKTGKVKDESNENKIRSIMTAMSTLEREMREEGNVEIVFSWIPGHFGVPGRQFALELARHHEVPARMKAKVWPAERVKVPTIHEFLYARRCGHYRNTNYDMHHSTREIKVDFKFNDIMEIYDYAKAKTEDEEYEREMMKLRDCISLLKRDYHQYLLVLVKSYSSEEGKTIGVGVLCENELLKTYRSYYYEMSIEDVQLHAVNTAIAFKIALKAVLFRLNDYKIRQNFGNKKKINMLVLSEDEGRYDMQEKFDIVRDTRPDVTDKIKELLTELKQNHNIDVVFSWYPTPPGLPGNQRADMLAKQATENHTIYKHFKDF